MKKKLRGKTEYCKANLPKTTYRRNDIVRNALKTLVDNVFWNMCAPSLGECTGKLFTGMHVNIHKFVLYLKIITPSDACEVVLVDTVHAIIVAVLTHSAIAIAKKICNYLKK